MKLPDFKEIGKDIQIGLRKHSPEILTALGITGLITTTVLAVKATPKAIQLIEEKKEENKVDELTPVEVVRTVWPCYIPSAVTCGLGVACVIGANSVNNKRNAALATAYTLSESALKTYQEKVVEQIGEKKEQKIRDEIAKDELARNPVSTKEVIITGKGETLCYDPISARYFKCDIEKLRKIEAKLNKELVSSMFVSLNEYYEEINISPTSIGDDIGWNINRELIEFELSSQLADDDTPCLVVSFTVEPRYDFRNLY